ncbi:hypothetical protein CAEBREN_19627 [Caenorhabditis brenneri]|uniref:Lin-15A/B-like domain-containing protein n=1 Tax=Caenorhabditis brenneri TaxID=135651 RepID=G0NT94_CAEBE|nr:hypothetical protein CAEBREN_19627 [Caenorhabditis brenneri]
MLTPENDDEQHDRTVQFVTDFIQKSGQDLSILKLESFANLLKSINPAARIPSWMEIKSEVDKRFNRTRNCCIFCRVDIPENESVKLKVDHAAIVLVTRVMVAGRSKFEAARILQSNNLKVCSSHFEDIFDQMFSGLNIEGTKNFSEAALGLMERWCDMFIRIKKNQFGEKKLKGKEDAKLKQKQKEKEEERERTRNDDEDKMRIEHDEEERSEAEVKEIKKENDNEQDKKKSENGTKKDQIVDEKKTDQDDEETPEFEVFELLSILNDFKTLYFRPSDSDSSVRTVKETLPIKKLLKMSPEQLVKSGCLSILVKINEKYNQIDKDCNNEEKIEEEPSTSSGRPKRARIENGEDESLTEEEKESSNEDSQKSWDGDRVDEWMRSPSEDSTGVKNEIEQLEELANAENKRNQSA